MRKTHFLQIIFVSLLLLAEVASPQERVTREGRGSCGALTGVFSVSETKQVHFSQGNLRYHVGTDTWRFAEEQYDMLLAANRLRSSCYSGWIDLFACGTSGYGKRNPYNWCVSKSEAEKAIAGTYYDWGLCNAISNGGNRAGIWRTLTMEEWEYLMKKRPRAYELQAYATIEGVDGILFLPDDCLLPEGLSFIPKTMAPEDNCYDESQWRRLEGLGALFLPFAGMLSLSLNSSYSGWVYNRWLGKTVPDYIWNDCLGYYWGTSTFQDTSDSLTSATDFDYDEDIKFHLAASSESLLFSVRLATDYSMAQLDSLAAEECKYLSYADESLSYKREGRLPGLFSVSDTMQVQFSQGDLQWQPSSNIWRFARNQYDVLENLHNYKFGCEYDGWLDRFSWGSSGYVDARGNGIDVPWPFYYSIANTRYDWGVYNAIANGGNKENLWRTLSDFEWFYLLTDRPHADELRSRATVHGVEGYLILSDDFQLPAGLSFTPRSENFHTNNYVTKEEWSRMEAAGAVFLPCHDDFSSDYWTTRRIGRSRAVPLSFDSLRLMVSYTGMYSLIMNPVRLVANAPKVRKFETSPSSNRIGGETSPILREVEGALNGRFSVSENRKVRFSKGNLLYRPSTETWRFATNQYDTLQIGAYYGCDSAYSGWMARFYWATSGFKGRTPCCSWRDNTEGDLADLYGSDFANYDWGTFNEIENGGCEVGLWRTLSKGEWSYLLSGRENALNLRSRASVCGFFGYLLLPDDFQLPEGLSFSPLREQFYENSYSEEQWHRMESAGAVFLPLTSYNFVRERQIGGLGIYWTSSGRLADYAYCVEFWDYDKIQYYNKENYTKEDGEMKVSSLSIHEDFSSVRLVTEE